MGQNNSIINLDDLARDIKVALQDGKDIIIDDNADKAVAAIKIAEKQIKQAINIIREHAKLALEPFNAKTLRGKYINITVSAPRKVNEYAVDDEADPMFWSKQVKMIPNKDAIESYVEKHDGSLPVGVHRNELKQSVSIKLKQSALDEFESNQELIES